MQYRLNSRSKSPRFRTALLATLVTPLSLIGSGCGLSSFSENAEIAQMAGDVIASVDESSGQVGGSFAYRLNSGATDRYFARWSDRPLELLLPSAWADPCHLIPFSYEHPVATRTFEDCTRGRAVLNGSVSLTYSESDDDFKLEEAGDSLIRNPEFVLTGRRGGELTVSGAEGGQKLTLSAIAEDGAKTFAWATLGMRRTLVRDGETIFDLGTATTEDIIVTGTSRNDRVMNGGSLVITDEVSGAVTTLVHENVTWTPDCTCASSGSLSGSKVLDGTSSDYSIEITGCGTANVTTDGVVESVEFDRCSSVEAAS
jgi:hypothetical protein